MRDNDTERKERRRARRKKKLRFLKHWHWKMVSRCYWVVVIAFMIINLCTPDRTFSPNENRNLAARPQMSRESLTSGRYFQDLNGYLTDQFFARDKWLTLNLGEQKLLGRKEAGGVYLGKDGYLLAKPVTPSEEAVSASEEAIRSFAEAYPSLKINMMLVPCAAAVMPDKLPANAPARDQNADISAVGHSLDGSNVNFINPEEALAAHASEDIYYRTDHHWTTAGAYYAFAAAEDSLGISDAGTQFTPYTVSTSFQGTLASQSGSHAVSDTIEVYAPQNVTTEYYVYYPDTGKSSSSVYDSSKLEEKDQYQVFFGGNHPVVEIHTTNSTDKNLLIFKDSYANCFVPFLLPYYDNIYMVDPRYYYDDIGTMMTTDGITDVLFLYSENTFAEDTTLTDVLSSVSGDTSADDTGQQSTGAAGDAATEAVTSTSASGDQTPAGK